MTQRWQEGMRAVSYDICFHLQITDEAREKEQLTTHLQEKVASLEKRLEQNLSGEEHVQELLREVSVSLGPANLGKAVMEISSVPKSFQAAEFADTEEAERILRLHGVLLADLRRTLSSEKGRVCSEMLVNSCILGLRKPT